MKKDKLNIRSYDNKQALMFPPVLGDFLPDGHLARLVDEVVEKVDLNPLYNKLSTVGNPSYDPQMMVKLIVYSYTISVRTSRKIASRLETDVAFMHLSGMQRPNFRTISDFRKNNIEELKWIFTQVVNVCKQLGIVGLGHIAIDSTVMKGNASSRRTYDEDQLDKIIHKELEQMIKEDEMEDKEYGYDKRGDELPEGLQKREDRVKKLKEVMEKLKKEDKKKINTTDTDSSFQKIQGRFKPGYRMQAAVDEKQGVMVACDVVNAHEDSEQLMPMLENIQDNFHDELQDKNKQKEKVNITADSGYSNMNTLSELEKNTNYECYIPDQRMQAKQRGKNNKQNSKFSKDNFIYHEDKDCYECINGKMLKYKKQRMEKNGQVARMYRMNKDCQKCQYFGDCTTNKKGREIYIYQNENLREKMRKKLISKNGKNIYRKRKMVVERAFADMKHTMGFRDFLLRGQKKVKGEGFLMATAYNMVRIYHFIKRKGIKLKQIIGGNIIGENYPAYMTG